jgi:hypothetical protein
MGRSFYASQLAAQERVADEVMVNKIPTAPTGKKVREKWVEAHGSVNDMADQLALVERRQYAIREAIRLLVNVARNPQARNNDAVLNNVIQALIDWEVES